MPENHYSHVDSQKQSLHLPLQILGRKVEWTYWGKIVRDCTAHNVPSENVYFELKKRKDLNSNMRQALGIYNADQRHKPCIQKVECNRYKDIIF